MLNDYQALVASLIRDDGGAISSVQLDNTIALAVSRYSTNFPRVLVADLSSNGTALLALPNDWLNEVSTVQSVEYPIVFPPLELEATHYQIYQTPTAYNLGFDFIPTGSVRLRYSVLHSVTDSVDTIPLTCREAVCYLAAASCCEQLAAYYASASDATIQADHVQRNSQSKDYLNLAKAYRSRYFTLLGIKETTLHGASSVVDWDLNNSLGQDRFNKPNRLR